MTQLMHKLAFACRPISMCRLCPRDGWLAQCAHRWDGAQLLGAIPEAAELSVQIDGNPATATLTFRGYEKTWRSERDPLLVRSFLAAIRTIAPDEKAGFVVKTGTSDMNVVAPVWGCPIVAYGPGDSSLDHTPNEHLPLYDYWQAVLVLEETLRNLGTMLVGHGIGAMLENSGGLSKKAAH